MIRALAFAALLNMLLPCYSQADSLNCDRIEQHLPIDTVTANAGIFTNLLKSSGSLNFESDRLFNQAQQRRKELAPPVDLCPAECGRPMLQFAFTSTPRIFLDSYPDQGSCDALYQLTRQKPLIFTSEPFDQSSDIRDWYKDFSRGANPEGEDLYRQCPGACSPQYKAYITTNSAGRFLIEAHVVCGPARDKTDNTYLLSSALRWICRPEARAVATPFPED